MTGIKNDGMQIFEIIDYASLKFKESGKPLESFTSEILMILSTFFEGNDHTFIFVDQLNGFVYVYRDLFAKRSLILQYSSNEIIFSSV